MLRLDPTATRTALAALFHLVARGHDRSRSPEHLVRSLAARDSTVIRINDIDLIATPDTPRLRSTPPRASAFLASPLLSSSEVPPIFRDDEKPRLSEAPLEAPASDDQG